MNAGSRPGATKPDDPADLGKSQAKSPRLRDEDEHAERLGWIAAIAGGGPLGRLKNASRLVEPDRLAAESAPGRDLANE